MYHPFNLTRAFICPTTRRGLWQTTTLSTRGETNTTGLDWRLRRYAHYTPGPSTTENSTNLPQTIDLLHTYRGLVALGKVKYDEEQVRVIMQVGHR